MVLARVLLGLACLLPGAAAWPADAAPLRSLVASDFEVIEDNPMPGRAASLARRAAAASQQLRDELARAGLYRMVDPEPARGTIDKLRAEHATLYECNGCAQTIGRAAGSELVLVGWVQVVSELILNLNIEVREVATDRVVLNKSVDMRGNNDESWQRAVRYMARDWAEKRAANPRYGQ